MRDLIAGQDLKLDGAGGSVRGDLQHIVRGAVEAKMKHELRE